MKENMQRHNPEYEERKQLDFLLCVFCKVHDLIVSDFVKIKVAKGHNTAVIKIQGGPGPFCTFSPEKAH